MTHQNEHLDARLDRIEEELQAVTNLATENAKTLVRELATVADRRKHLDDTIAEIRRAVTTLTEDGRRTRQQIESAIMFARVGRFMITSVAAIGAFALGVAGWWAEMKAAASKLFGP